MTRATAAFLIAFGLIVVAVVCAYSMHVTAACERTGGRYLCESRLSCDCYYGCRP